MTNKLGEHGEDGTPETPPEEKDSDEIAAEILSDPELPAEDFARARTDKEFMSGLIEKRRAAPPPEEKPEGDDETKKPGEGKDEGKGADETPPPKKKGPRRGGFRRQVERLNDDLAVSRRENDRLRAQLAGGGKGKSPFPSAPVETPEPNEDDFEGHAEFIEARAEWKAEQKVEAALKKRDQVQAARSVEAQRKQAEADLAGALYTQAETSRAEHEDFQEIVDQADEAMAEEGLEWQGSQAHALAVTGQFGEIAYYLGQHPEEAVRLAKIANPGNFNRALGAIEAKLEAAAAAPPKADPKGGKGAGPPPPAKVPLKTPVGEIVKGSGAGVPKDAEWWANKASPEEYAAARKKRQRLGTGL